MVYKQLSLTNSSDIISDNIFTYGNIASPSIISSNTISPYSGSVVTVTSNLTVNEYLSVLQPYKITTVNTATYSIALTDDIIFVEYSTTGQCTLTLPEIATMTNNKHIYKIIDGSGNASTNNIIINASGSDTIIGYNSVAINSNFNSLTLMAHNATWFLI